MSDKTPIKVIVDLDIGCDDAWALFMLLQAQLTGNYKVMAITCVNGNTSVDNCARNVERCFAVFQEQFNTKLNIPIYKGTPESLLEKHRHGDAPFHGHDGLCDVLGNNTPTGEHVQSEHAAIALTQLVKEHPNEIVMLCLGPLTNLAMAMKLNPSIAGQLRELYVMGGNYRAKGNTTRCGEFNFYVDPEAAYIVLEKAKCPMTIVTWETASPPMYTVPWLWRENILGAVQTPIAKFMYKIESARRDYNGRNGWTSCDSVMMACFLFKADMVVRSSAYHVTVELAGNYTRGQMILDHLKIETTNAEIIEEINCEVFKRYMLWTAGDKCV